MPVIRQFISSYLSIIDRYLLREFFLNLLAVTSVLWLIFVATRFARYLAQAAVGNLPSDVIFILLGYNSLGALSILLPMGTFLAVMLALGRMNADNELTVMSSCGIPHNQLLRNVGLFSGVIAVIVASLSLIIVPTVLSDRYELEQRAKMSADTSGLIAGSFKDSRSGDWTFYSQSVSDEGIMQDIFIEIHKAERPLVFRSKTGRFQIDTETNDKYLILEEGYRYEGEAGELDFTVVQYQSHSLLVEKGEEKQVTERHKALPSTLLWQRGELRDLAELQWRTSAAIMTLLLSMLAISLANVGPRKGRYAGIFPAILVYIIYSNLLGVTRAWVSKGVMAPWLGAIWVHILMLCILLLMMNRHKLKAKWMQVKLQNKKEVVS